MKFSQRTQWELGENALTRAVRARRVAGGEIVDLTVSNPTECGFAYDEAVWLAPLSRAGAMRYEPDSLGMGHARAAVAKYYQGRGLQVGIEELCLTTSTSEAYSFLFRLLCDPGDEVLIGRPSYPLLEFIAQLDSVVVREYPLWLDPSVGADGSHAWHVDVEALRGMVSARTRVVIVVHPNNPTGSLIDEAERAALEALCAERGLALIVDEVFLDYAIGGASAQTFAAVGETLTFVLSGMSKVCGLPQMKLSWIAASGPAAVVKDAMARLEVIADTFLSVNAPTQWALPQWLEARETMQAQIRARVEENLRTLDGRLAGTCAQRLPLEGGWTAILRVPRSVEDASGTPQPFAMAALERGVLVQPGDFYGLGDGYCVVSLLTRPEIWERGLASLPID